ncbi:MAG: hypothetical protein BIFFINMI_02344 [Phycisphaerae bacterium]|nr:hypothetical protein [Phycisphaerae bacterium]
MPRQQRDNPKGPQPGDGAEAIHDDVGDIDEILESAELDDLVGQEVTRELEAARTPTADKAAAQTELAELDDELARHAEETIQESLDEAEFDLDGDFLSQEDVSRIMAEEAAGIPALADPTPAAPAAMPAEAGRPSSPHSFEQVAAEPAPAPADEFPTDLEAELESSAAAAGRVEDRQADRTLSEAVATPASVAPKEAPPREAARPTRESPPVPVAAPVCQAAAETSPIAQDIDEDVASLLDAADLPEGESTPRKARRWGLAWRPAAIRTMTLADWPFRGVPALAKNILGVVGGVTAVVGLAIWVIVLIR